MDYDKFYFIEAIFEDEKTNKIIKVRFEEDDKFYRYLEPLLDKGIAESMTALKVESLYVLKDDYNYLCGKTYQMTAKTIFDQRQKDNSYIGFAGYIVIDRVCFKNIEPMRVKPVDDKWIEINMCDIEIQYQSRIYYNIEEDKEEE